MCRLQPTEYSQEGSTHKKKQMLAEDWTGTADKERTKMDTVKQGIVIQDTDGQYTLEMTQHDRIVRKENSQRGHTQIGHGHIGHSQITHPFSIYLDQTGLGSTGQCKTLHS